jgi:hypothetical protein
LLVGRPKSPFPDPFAGKIFDVRGKAFGAINLVRETVCGWIAGGDAFFILIYCLILCFSDWSTPTCTAAIRFTARPVLLLSFPLSARSADLGALVRMHREEFRDIRPPI